MFVDAVLANVLVFAVGQAFAWLFLRTGRFWVGAAATTALWASMDCWLVQRFLLATPAEGQQLAVLILQATALSEQKRALVVQASRNLADVTYF